MQRNTPLHHFFMPDAAQAQNRHRLENRILFKTKAPEGGDLVLEIYIERQPAESI